jgi:diguanylate cyclase (GGDEF)-like protein
LRVLIVDEDASANDATRLAVERFGYRCSVVERASEGWDRFVAESPEVVLVSVSLPAAGGLELLHRINADRGASGTYLVAMVQADDGEGLFAAMASGADDFLTRPLHPEQLHARLQVAERFTMVQRQLSDGRTELERVRQALRASARTDALTRLWNRLQLSDDLDLFQGQLQRYGHRYAVAILDLDRFGAYNEVHGQLAGDEALRVVAQALAKQLRTGDRAYRYGGDELVFLLPEQSIESARIAVERIRAGIDGLGLPHPANPPWNLVTVSVGIATFATDDDVTYDALLRRAEEALKRAKALGGNGVANGE